MKLSDVRQAGPPNPSCASLSWSTATSLLNRDQFFPGYCFVFTKEHVTELFHLDPVDRQGVMEEVNRVAAALATVFAPTKLNYELLGNMVPHMHWHLVPRFADRSRSGRGRSGASRTKRSC